MKHILIIVAILGLFGTMTNLLYISPLPSLVAASIFPLLIGYIKKVPKVVFWLLVFFFISILSVLIYYPPSLWNYGFYRYDGNFIISYLPLLVFPFLSANLNIERIFKLFLLFATTLNFLAFVYFKFSGAPYFISFFLATNAAGGFFSIMASLALVFYLQNKKLLYLLVFFMQIGFMFATTSRGSMLGLVLGILFFLFLKYKKRYLITCSFIVIIFVQAVLIFNSYHIYEKELKNKPYEKYYSSVHDSIIKRHGHVDAKKANVFIRLYDTWPRGIHAFLNSPLVGAGFGSVNDIPIKKDETISFVVNFNKQDEKQFNDSHAHHSYIHILGEQGMIGLGIFLIFWLSIYRFLLTNKYNMPIRNFLLISFFNISIMSFTEHRITTPSNALPFVLAFCLYYIFVNHQKKKHLQLNEASS